MLPSIGISLRGMTIRSIEMAFGQPLSRRYWSYRSRFALATISYLVRCQLPPTLDVNRNIKAGAIPDLHRCLAMFSESWESHDVTVMLPLKGMSSRDRTAPADWYNLRKPQVICETFCQRWHSAPVKTWIVEESRGALHPLPPANWGTPVGISGRHTEAATWPSR